MAAHVQAPKFEEHFWGPGNKGYDILYHNFKAGVSASRELNEFLKERYMHTYISSTSFVLH
jgi:hypothetical protein